MSDRLAVVPQYLLPKQLLTVLAGARPADRSVITDGQARPGFQFTIPFLNKQEAPKAAAPDLSAPSAPVAAPEPAPPTPAVVAAPEPPLPAPPPAVIAATSPLTLSGCR